jgi:hypothetical protein
LLIEALNHEACLLRMEMCKNNSLKEVNFRDLTIVAETTIMCSQRCWSAT